MNIKLKLTEIADMQFSFDDKFTLQQPHIRIAVTGLNACVHGILQADFPTVRIQSSEPDTNLLFEIIAAEIDFSESIRGIKDGTPLAFLEIILPTSQSRPDSAWIETVRNLWRQSNGNTL